MWIPCGLRFWILKSVLCLLLVGHIANISAARMMTVFGSHEYGTGTWKANISWTTLKARFMGPTWGPSGADRTQGAPCWPHGSCYLGSDVNRMWKLCSWCAHRSNVQYFIPFPKLEWEIKHCLTCIFEILVVTAMVYIKVMIYDKNINQEQLIKMMFLWGFHYMRKAAHQN